MSQLTRVLRRVSTDIVARLPAPPPPAPSDADKDAMKASARSFGREFDEDDSAKEDRGVEDHSLTRDDSLDGTETHVSANNRAHGITIDEENESADDVRAAQHVAASERLAKVSLLSLF